MQEFSPRRVQERCKDELKPITQRRELWEKTMQEMYPLLTLIAVRLLSLHATSCSAERNWSRWHFSMRDNRKRLAVKKADKLIFISSQAAVQHRGNETGLFEQDIAAMCEAQQEEEDEQCEGEEVSDQDCDEIYRYYCATDAF
ncbi:TPA: hypothetical protein ACH3X1_009197 [Trebouxia sp. C0004]